MNTLTLLTRLLSAIRAAAKMLAKSGASWQVCAYVEQAVMALEAARQQAEMEGRQKVDFAGSPGEKKWPEIKK